MVREYGKNIGKPPIRVRHADLKRCSDESPYKSKCPACPDGILLIYRDQDTLKLLERDVCVVCGQAFIYEDIGNLEPREGRARP